MKEINYGHRLHGQGLKLIFVNVKITIDIGTIIVYSNNVTYNGHRKRETI